MSTIGIIGAGTMGSGIAQVTALAHMETLLFDVSPSALSGAMVRIDEQIRKRVDSGKISSPEAETALSSIHPCKALDELHDAEFCIEAAAEDFTIKQEIFRQLERIARSGAILATNTSSFSVSKIAAPCNSPASVVGMHFFNPPPAMALVEVVRGAQTSDETVSRTTDMVVRLKKIPIVCRDTPGFVVNRCARPFYGEALRLLGEGIADVETLDRIVRVEGGFKMGPFELMDLIGIDVNYAVTRSVYEQFFYDSRFRPHPIQREMVEAGKLGRKTKQGFYRY